MELVRVPLTTACALLVATLALRGTPQPSIELASDHGGHLFGARLSASGPVLAAIDTTRGCQDRDSPCAAVLRIDRIAGDRVVDEARIVLEEAPYQGRIPEVAIDGDTAVTYYPWGQLDVFERAGAWTHTQRISLFYDCYTDPYFSAAHLAEGLLVVETPDASCILERHDGRWVFFQQILHKTWDITAVADHRMFMTKGASVIEFRREHEWVGHTVVSDAGRELRNIAVSDRWIVVADRHTISVYDRARDHALVTTFEARATDYLSADDNTIVAGGAGTQMWHFDGTAWSGSIALSELGTAPNAVADLVWVGEPGAGHVHGYAH